MEAMREAPWINDFKRTNRGDLYRKYFQVYEAYINERRCSTVENRSRMGHSFPPWYQSKSYQLDLQGFWFP